MKINEVSYFQRLFAVAPKKAPEFAPGILHRNATFCLSFSNAKSSDSVENQSFS